MGDPRRALNISFRWLIDNTRNVTHGFTSGFPFSLPGIWASPSSVGTLTTPDLSDGRRNRHFNCNWRRQLSIKPQPCWAYWNATSGINSPLWHRKSLDTMISCRRFESTSLTCKTDSSSPFWTRLLWRGRATWLISWTARLALCCFTVRRAKPSIFWKVSWRRLMFKSSKICGWREEDLVEFVLWLVMRKLLSVVSNVSKRRGSNPKSFQVYCLLIVFNFFYFKYSYLLTLRKI